MSIDLSTPEAARKAIADIHAEQRKLQERGDSLQQQAEAKAADLAAATKRIAELEARSAMTSRASEGDVSKYVDGSKVRMVAETDAKGVTRAGLLDDAPTCDWQRELQGLCEQRTYVNMLTKRGHSPRTDAKIADHMKRAPEAIQRIFSDASGAGAEWVPDVLVSDLASELYAARRVESLFPTWQMPSKELRIPFLTLQTVPYLKSVPTADDPSSYTASTDTTAQRSITASSFAVRTQVDEDASEDSIVPMIPTVRANIVAAITDAIEDAIINGDTTATHQDNDLSGWNPRSRWGGTVGGSADHRRAWLGLRARAADVSSTTDQSGAKTYAGFLAARSNLDSPHGVAGDLVCIVSPEYYVASMLGFTEVATVDKYGSNAVVLSGEVGRIAGVPIIVSEFMTSDLNASGLYDGVTTTQSGFLLVNRQRFYMGALKSTTVELDKNIKSGVIDMVATARKAFFTIDGSSKKNLHFSYNL